MIRQKKRFRNEELPLIPMLCLITILISALLSIVSFAKITIVNSPMLHGSICYGPKKYDQDKRLILTVTLTNEYVNIRGRNDMVGHSVYYTEVWNFTDSETKKVYEFKATNQLKETFQNERSINVENGATTLHLSERDEIKLLAVMNDSGTSQGEFQKVLHNKKGEFLVNLYYEATSIDLIDTGDTLINIKVYNQYALRKKRLKKAEEMYDFIFDWGNTTPVYLQRRSELKREIDRLKELLYNHNYYEIVTSIEDYTTSPIDLYSALNSKFLQIQKVCWDYNDLENVTLICADDVKYDKFIKFTDVAKISGFKNIQCGVLNR